MKPLPGRLVAWCQRLDEADLLNAAVQIAAHIQHPERIDRSTLERVRDRLSRAQERGQFSDEADQQDLANVVAGLDELLKKIPSN